MLPGVTFTLHRHRAPFNQSGNKHHKPRSSQYNASRVAYPSGHTRRGATSLPHLRPGTGEEHVWHWRTNSFISVTSLVVLRISWLYLYMILHIFRVYTKCILCGVPNYLNWFEDGNKNMQLHMRFTNLISWIEPTCSPWIYHAKICDSELPCNESKQTVPVVNEISSKLLCMNFNVKKIICFPPETFVRHKGLVLFFVCAHVLAYWC